jgi:hypothetical protein
MLEYANFLKERILTEAKNKGILAREVRIKGLGMGKEMMGIEKSAGIVRMIGI